jgi:thermostable 8-oxoguanine DNA glycosylase
MAGINAEDAATHARVEVGLGSGAGVAPATGTEIVLMGTGWRRCIDWYDATYLGTPAFWIEQTRHCQRPSTYQIGATLIEEIALCLLGGYGISEQMAYAAFARLRDRGMLVSGSVDPDEIQRALAEPLLVNGRPRPARYRFPTLKAHRLAAVIEQLSTAQPPSIDRPRELRDWLTTLPGVGPKTASWVVRNLTRSDEIAVIDIHIRRAGVVAGVFAPEWKLPRDYRYFEEAFVAWAQLGGVGTADLDACIWSSLATLGRGARALFGVAKLGDLD